MGSADLWVLWLSVGIIGVAMTAGYQMDRSTRDERIEHEVATWEAFRAAPRPRHSVMVIAVDPGGHQFKGSCSCGWKSSHASRDRDWAARDVQIHLDEAVGRLDGDAPSTA